VTASLISRLVAAPRRFRFDAAIRVLMHDRHRGEPGEAARFRTAPGLAYPPADILAVTPREGGHPPDVTVGLGGLAGPSGVLPRSYTEQIVQQVRLGARGLHVFIDLLGHRMLAAFAAAGMKYRPARSAERAALAEAPDPHREVLVALVGEAVMPTARPREEQDTLLHYAGLLAAWPRSAERLETMLTDWLGRSVTVRQFAGAWLTLDVAERTRLPKGRDGGAFARVGYDAAIGIRAWDAQARVVLGLGPLTAAEFRDVLPDRPAAARLVMMARSFLGPAASFAINPVLRRSEVPPCRPGGGNRLGWDCWLPAPNRAGDAADAVFAAGSIERLHTTRSH
jgi:type VI secretion system protein ImpH